MNSTLKNRWWATVVAICLFFILVNDEIVLASDMDIDPGPEAKMIGYSSIAVDIVGFVFACGNFYYGVKKERSTPGWQIGGWLFGGLNAAGGIYFLSRMIEENKIGDLYPWLGGIHFVVAGLNIGFTIWSSSQPEKKEQKLTLAPMIMPDIRGRPAFGVGLRLVDW